MSKGLEVQDKFVDKVLKSACFHKFIKDARECNKKLKTLEIIKKKKIDVWSLLICINISDTDYEALTCYNKNRPSRYVISKKEFKLLKEVLL